MDPMDPTSTVGLNPKPLGSPTRSHLIFHNIKHYFSLSGLLHPEKTFTAELNRAEQRAKMSPTSINPKSSGAPSGDPSVDPSEDYGFPKASKAPGEQFEPRQTATSDDYTPDPEKSLPLSQERQELVDDIIALYSCAPTPQRIKRYTPSCIYDDAFAYANDRYKVAGQWFALPNLFSKSVNEGYEVVRSDDEVIQFKNKQSYTPRPRLPLPLSSLPTITITGLVTLSLSPSSLHTPFLQVKYHKDQANEKDYSHQGAGFSFKKWQADNVVRFMDAPELREFEGDKGAKEEVRKYDMGKEEGGRMGTGKEEGIGKRRDSGAPKEYRGYVH